jgi:hypothetical protein
MSQVKLDFDHKSIPQKLQKADTIVTKSTGNPILATDAAAVDAVRLAAYNLNISANNAKAADVAAVTAHSQQDTDEAALNAAVSALGGIVQTNSGGDETEILSTGFDVRSSSHAPVVLEAPQHVSVTTGDLAGVLDVACDAHKGVSFLPQFTTDLTGAAGWQNGLVSRASHMKISGLVSGTKYAVRLAMIGAGQTQGPWSDIVQKMAP